MISASELDIFTLMSMGIDSLLELAPSGHCEVLGTSALADVNTSLSR